MKVAVLGAAGQLGTDVVNALSQGDDYEVLAMGRDLLDITDSETVRKVLVDERPEVVVNSAAFHQVDVCEDQP